MYGIHPANICLTAASKYLYNFQLGNYQNRNDFKGNLLVFTVSSNVLFKLLAKCFKNAPILLHLSGPFSHEFIFGRLDILLSQSDRLHTTFNFLLF